ncbi:CxxC motif-containing protein (DUF1111 family) [Rivibacter subsaxonicus]|uniref:CxxC motif-containing protein (DUF1111 family) n=2 Tax=Rivibacter subsaxonicus TaxID=457575 RepID=A0A4Q7W194_9BURK|nr:di-heme oxidoredictase family protein [Rivibacter subsaxonicus]RZU02783.1 CxxC motif-containing protein (DUF1111 family) [Rivibacter subsaxonicus]
MNTHARWLCWSSLALLQAACNPTEDETSNVAAAAPAAASEQRAQIAAVQADRSQFVSTSAIGSGARDPGPRGALVGAGGPLPGLSVLELALFQVGREDFIEEESASDGLGPTMNLDSCGGCHSQPAMGGTSPAVNPQVAFAGKLSATNVVPPFITLKGPVREARFVKGSDGQRDGGVHALFTLAGRTDARDCRVRQPDFAGAMAAGNVIFRIPTPLFGAGLIELIPDGEILANLGRNTSTKRSLGIRGRGNIMPAAQAISAQPNKNGNDGTLGRFGWKAQNKSLLVFSGEAYNVEMGITNDLFPTERDETEACQYTHSPNSVTHLEAATPLEAISSIEKFTAFMRLLAPPTPSTDQPGGSASIANGKTLFANVGCALCHVPSLRTGNASVAALRYKNVNLYSDLLLHDMGAGLADGILQGEAGAREFRTAPLWGLGQRLFFLHDGRTSDLKQAVLAHRSDGSEANGVVSKFGALADREQQDLLNFLRSL